MNEFLYIILLFTIAFFSSLIYLTKKKSSSLLSYLLNLNIEYILVGIIISYTIKSNNVTFSQDFTPYLYFTLFLTGILFGAQYKFSLLKTINVKFYLFIFIIFLLYTVSLVVLLKLLGFNTQLAILLNTTFPFSCILLNKLMKNKASNYYNNLIVLSLYPLFSYTAYTFFVNSFLNTIDFIMFFLISAFVIIIISKTIHFNDKRVLYTLNIILLILFTGLTMTFNLAPLSAGFVIGIFIANIKYGDVFINTTDFLDKFLYIILFILIGIYLYDKIMLINISKIVALISILFFTLFIRKYLAQQLFNKLIINSNDKINLVNIGIIPILFIIEVKTIGIIDLTDMLPTIFLLFIITEIYNFMVLKNENS